MVNANFFDITYEEETIPQYLTLEDLATDDESTIDSANDPVNDDMELDDEELELDLEDGYQTPIREPPTNDDGDEYDDLPDPPNLIRYMNQALNDVIENLDVDYPLTNTILPLYNPQPVARVLNFDDV